jgi:hypothetical protein
VAQIQHTFEERLGHEVDDSTIYRLLNRHGWRKLMPRPEHPKADSQAQAQFQQNFSAQVEAAVATREAGDERPVLIMAQDEGCGCPALVVRSEVRAPPGRYCQLDEEMEEFLREREEKSGGWEMMMWCYAAVFPLVTSFHVRKRSCMRAR